MSLQSLQSFLNDWNEIMSIKKWREENNIVIDERYIAKANKREYILKKVWQSVTIFAFLGGMLLGMYI